MNDIEQIALVSLVGFVLWKFFHAPAIAGKMQSGLPYFLNYNVPQMGGADLPLPALNSGQENIANFANTNLGTL